MEPNLNLLNSIFDTKTLSFIYEFCQKEDITAKEVTEIVDGAIEQLHNLPVSLEDAGILVELMVKNLPFMRVPEFWKEASMVTKVANTAKFRNMIQ